MKLQTVFFITVIRRIMDATIEKYENALIEIDAEKRTILHKSTGDIYVFDNNVSTSYIHYLITHLHNICNPEHKTLEYNMYGVFTILIGFCRLSLETTSVVHSICCEFTIIYDIMKISFYMSEPQLNTGDDYTIKHVTIIATKQNDVFK